MGFFLEVLAAGDLLKFPILTLQPETLRSLLRLCIQSRHFPGCIDPEGRRYENLSGGHASNASFPGLAAPCHESLVSQEYVHQSKKNPGVRPGFFHFHRGVLVFSQKSPQAFGSELKSGEGPVQEGVDRHSQHQGAKDRIRFQQYHHIGRVAVVKGVYVEVFKM